MQKYELGWMSAQGRKLLRQKGRQNTSNKVTCSKLSAVIPTANFQQKDLSKEQVCRFLSNIESHKRLLSCSQ
jgi:hypothetical protein